MLGRRRGPARMAAALAFLGLGAANAQVDVVFTAFTAVDEYDARTYRAIWDEYGQRIVAALESQTCLPFVESTVRATVAEAVSHSGGPEHPMRLRASYARSIKQSTLVHELGHRHLWQLEERLAHVDGHMTLYLILDRVWAQVWGREFARKRVRGESRWDGEYADAWAWARALTPAERARLWNRLLAINGFAHDCKSPPGEAR